MQKWQNIAYIGKWKTHEIDSFNIELFLLFQWKQKNSFKIINTFITRMLRSSIIPWGSMKSSLQNLKKNLLLHSWIYSSNNLFLSLLEARDFNGKFNVIICWWYTPSIIGTEETFLQDFHQYQKTLNICFLGTSGFNTTQYCVTPLRKG